MEAVMEFMYAQVFNSHELLGSCGKTKQQNNYSTNTDKNHVFRAKVYRLQ